MKSEIYWITFHGPAQHDALITFNNSRTFWRRLFTTSQKLFSCIWTSWFLCVSAKPGRGPYLGAKEARKRPEMTSPKPVWARHQSKMSHLLRKSPPAYGQMNSRGSWPNLVVDCVYKKMWILAKLRNRNVNFMAKNNGHQNFRYSLGIPGPPPSYLGYIPNQNHFLDVFRYITHIWA